MNPPPELANNVCKGQDLKTENNTTQRKVVKISMIDPDATDSSSDEEEGKTRVKRYVNSIDLETRNSDNDAKNVTRARSCHKRAISEVRSCERLLKKFKLTPDGDGKRKFVGVRQRRWGKWAAEIRITGKQRLWLGTYDTAEEAAVVYDNAAIQLRGPDALTNFITPTQRQEEGCKEQDKKPQVINVVTSVSSGG